MRLLPQFSSAELALANISDILTQSLNLAVLEPLQRHKSTVFALRASVTSQRNKRANHVAANSAIQRDSVRNPNHEEQVAKASRCLNEYVDASNRLDEDYQRYQEERTEELLLLLRSLVTLQSDYCKQSQGVWKELEASLTADTPQSPSFLATTTNTSAGRGAPDSSIWSSKFSPSAKPSSSLLDLEEEVEEEEGRESDFFESV